jgi:hypothetical protein
MRLIENQEIKLLRRNHNVVPIGAKGTGRASCSPCPQGQPADADATDPNEPPTHSHPCPCCGGRMIIIETFARGCQPRYQPSTPTVAIRIDTS